MEISLGITPATGADAVTQCNFFKGLMRNRIGRDPYGAYLHMTANGHHTMEMQVVIQAPEDAAAMEWAKRARETAELIWEEVKHGKKPEINILIRRRVLDDTERDLP